LSSGLDVSGDREGLEAETFAMETLADDSVIYVSEQRPDDDYAVAVVEEV